jgi:MFS transporter, UMF1 family
MVGPILFAQMLVWTSSANVAILSLLVFIVAGMLTVSRVNLRRGIEQAKA